MSGNLIGVNSILLFLSNLSPILSWFVLYNMYISHSIHYISKHWINISNYRMELEVGISLIEIFTVILLLNVSYAILLYIIKYMEKDKNKIRFIGIMMAFTFNMIVLIISQDVIVLFIGWEMIGIISCLLIGYYNNRIEATRSGLKAIFYNRVGDISLLYFIVSVINLFNDISISLFSFLYFIVNGNSLLQY